MNRAIVLAAGSGTRFGSQKLFAPLWGEMVLFWSLKALQEHHLIDEIILVISSNIEKDAYELSINFSKIRQIIRGGETRFESSRKAFLALRPDTGDFLIFHNAANPGLTSDEISNVIKGAKKNGAAGVGRKIFAAIRKRGGKKSEILPREELWEMETPQALRADIFEKGMKKWQKKEPNFPIDDLELAEISGIVPEIVPANPHNRKITVPEDLVFLERHRNFEMRAGIGEDSHPFSHAEKPCILAGLKIPENPGFEGNSDGDVALHALCNALLSAIGKNSFSSISDPLCQKGITDSRIYLFEVLKILEENHAEIENIALSFEGKRPKLERHFSEMRRNLAEILNLSEERIGLTAHSGEGLSEYGKGNGVRCIASALIRLYRE